MVSFHFGPRMERRRTPRRRGLSSAEIRQELSVNASTQQSEVIARLLPINGNPEITGCKDRPHICGKEAACRSFKDNTSKCVCPHDLSPPTTDLKCPNRLIVPLTPRPIPNIIPPNGNSTNSTTALPEAEQVFIINCSYKYHLSIYKYAYNLLQT